MIENLSAADLSRRMFDVRTKKEQLEAELKEVNKEYDYIRMGLLPSKFEEEGLKALKIEGVGAVSLVADLHVSILADNRKEAYDFFRDIGKESLITSTINAQTLKAVVKQMIESGDSIPQELIKISPFTKAVIRTK